MRQGMGTCQSRVLARASGGPQNHWTWPRGSPGDGKASWTAVPGPGSWHLYRVFSSLSISSFFTFFLPPGTNQHSKDVAGNTTDEVLALLEIIFCQGDVGN